MCMVFRLIFVEEVKCLRNMKVSSPPLLFSAGKVKVYLNEEIRFGSYVLDRLL